MTQLTKKERVEQLFTERLNRLYENPDRTGRYSDETIIYYNSNYSPDDDIMIVDKEDNVVNFDCNYIINPLLEIFEQEHLIVVGPNKLQSTVIEVLNEMELEELEGIDIQYIDVWDGCKDEMNVEWRKEMIPSPQGIPYPGKNLYVNNKVVGLHSETPGYVAEAVLQFLGYHVNYEETDHTDKE